LGGQLFEDELQVTWVIHNKIQFNLRQNLNLNWIFAQYFLILCGNDVVGRTTKQPHTPRYTGGHSSQV